MNKRVCESKNVKKIHKNKTVVIMYLSKNHFKGRDKNDSNGSSSRKKGRQILAKSS